MTEQEATDYLFNELTKLDVMVTYTACKALVARIREPHIDALRGHEGQEHYGDGWEAYRPEGYDK